MMVDEEAILISLSCFPWSHWEQIDFSKWKEPRPVSLYLEVKGE